MSLEAKLEELTAAVAGLTKITTDLYNLRADTAEQVKNLASTGKGATAGKKTETAAETKTETKTETKPEKGEDLSAVYEEIRQLIGGYVGGSEREEERKARKAKVKALLNHKQIKKDGVEDATSAEHIADFDLFKKQMGLLKTKGDLTEPAAAEDDALV